MPDIDDLNIDAVVAAVAGEIDVQPGNGLLDAIKKAQVIIKKKQQQLDADMQPIPGPAYIPANDADLPVGHHIEAHYNDEPIGWDDGPDDEPDGPDDEPAPKKKKFQFKPKSKTTAPEELSRNVLFSRAQKIARPLNMVAAGDALCQGCGCRANQHGSLVKRYQSCTRCESCNGFIHMEQLNRVYFTEFLRWTKRWLKASKNHSMARLREIWPRTRNITNIKYCGGCDAATFSNDLHGLVKRQEGLQCSSCFQCSTCCKCVTCEQCKRRKHEKEICKTCKVCNQCCQCKECPVCSRDASYNYCGYAFTDRQKKNDRGCGRCYKCCDCTDRGKVPFGSFAKPIFHKPTLKQHNGNPTSRYIAAEIECAGIYGSGKPIYEVVRRWGGATVGDGSLGEYGFEVNTAPSGGDLYAQQIYEICAAIKLQNGFIDHRCGLHVHIDGRDMNYYDVRRLVRIYAAIEDGLFAMVSPARIEGVMDNDGKLHQYCQPCGKKYVASIEEGRLPYDKIKTDVITSVYSKPSTQNLRNRKRGNGIPRYNALNLHSWFYRGTIESRMFDGCIEPDPIIKWGVCWATIIDFVVNNDDATIAREMVGSSISCLMKTMGKNDLLKQFIKERVNKFGNAIQKEEVSRY